MIQCLQELRTEIKKLEEKVKELDEAGSAQVPIAYFSLLSSHFTILSQIGEVESGATGISEFCPKREVERYQERKRPACC